MILYPFLLLATGLLSTISREHTVTLFLNPLQQVRHNTLPRNGDTDLKILKVSISRDSNNALGISIVEAKLNANSVS